MLAIGRNLTYYYLIGSAQGAKKTKRDKKMTTAAKVKLLEVNDNRVKWFEVSGFGFEETEVFGLTEDDRILDADGCPCTPGDYYEAQARRAITSYELGL